VWVCGLDSSDSGYGPVPVCCEHGTETWGSIKGGEFLDWLINCQLLKKDSAPRLKLINDS